MTTSSPYLVERNLLKTNSLLRTSLLILVISAILLGITRTVVDPDLWGHLRFGLDTLHNGTITRQDPYAYTTTGQVWINHEWLAEVLFALVWQAAGNPGLILLKVGVEVLTLALAFLILFRQRVEPLWACLYVMLFLPMMLPSMWTVRPQMFTNLMFALILFIIILADRGHYGWLWAAPPVLCFWMNAHGGVLAGTAVLVIWSAAHLAFHPHSWKRVLTPLAVALIATLVNPYGVGLWSFLLRTATGTRLEIAEWAPLQIQSPVGLLYLIGLALTAVGILYSGRPKRWPLLAVFAALTLLPLLAIRHLPLYALGLVMLNGEYFEGLRLRYLPERDKKRRLPEWAGILPLAGAVFIWILAVPRLGNLAVRDSNADFVFPLSAVQIIKESGVSGNLMIDFNWGEYALWQLSPRVKVGMDGRRETVFPEKMYAEYVNFYSGVGQWDAVLKDYPTDMVLMQSGSAPVNLLKLSSEWQVVYADKLSTLLVRRDSSAAQGLLKAASDFNSPLNETRFP
jgi:hypothetical protein